MKKFISEKEDNRYYKLSLKTIFGEAFNGETVSILPSGVVGSIRNKRDSITYFGIRNSDNTIDKLVDYEINISNSANNSNISMLYSAIVFLIYFKKEEMKYYIKAYNGSHINDGGLPNIILQIKEPYYIKTKELLMLNDCYFQIKVEDYSLEITQLSSRYSNEVKVFKYYVKDNKEIIIGRDKSCDIILNWDKSYSKFQAVISYDEFLEQWKITDGGIKGPSRNGSWIFISKSVEIKEGTTFRVANSKIEVNLIDVGDESQLY